MLTRSSLAMGLTLAAALPAMAAIPSPAAVVADGLPTVPEALVEATRPYLQSRRAVFEGWNAADRSMLIRTRFGATEQLHVVSTPGAERRQISFEDELITFARLSPRGDKLVVQKDVGGDEFFQLYALRAGRLILLTDGKSRNLLGAWSPDGKLIGYASNRRNGADMDLYVSDPSTPGTERLVAKVSGGGWNIADFSADSRTALVTNLISVNQTIIYELDLASGALSRITGAKAQVSYAGARYAPDGTIWTTSDEGSDFLRLGKLDRKTGVFAPVSSEPKWDVSDFAISPDGAFISYAVNEAGVTRVRVMDMATGAIRKVDGLPAGVLDKSLGQAIQIAPWGAIGLSLSSARVPGDAFSVDPKTLAVSRWTHSESGGLDPDTNVEPKLVEVKSFDGELVSGFIYRPDPAKFPGKRPMVIDIHGGPESLSRPIFMGSWNYLINELGIAVFRPNVRGSTGFGKRFVNLDNGPFKREDSVKDIGSFLDTLSQDPALDPSRFGVSGISYGGYMCYAVAIRYGDRLRGASCGVAISNFVTFLENTQSYRRDHRRLEYGDERDPKQRAKLEEISPLTSIDKVRIPMLVATGNNDPRVPPSEADQVIKAIRAQGGTVGHMLVSNEGHIFEKKENVDYHFWTVLQFWRRNLLGETVE